MILRYIHTENYPPIRNVTISDLGSVVIIAGANGSGKSRLKQAIIQTFQSPNGPQVDIDVEATRPEEEQKWGKRRVSIRRTSPDPLFTDYMNSRTRGGGYTGTMIQIDSSRAVQSINFHPLYLTSIDPDDEEMDYRWFMNPFTGRWNETVNRIYRKIASRDRKIAQYNKDHPNGQIQDALIENPDPFIPYQDLFAELLPGKILLPINPQHQKEFEYTTQAGNVLPFSSLSSGEQEVVKITFDLLAKRITHCIFLIDEPELHLHPTLAFRLVETLKNMGGGTNQFIFFTHSADLISTYYSTGNVFFIDNTQDGTNQAHRLSDLDTSHRGLVNAMSENLGLFAVGKKLLFVEGQQASRDRLTYHKIAQQYFPEAYILPSGSAGTVTALDQFGTELQGTIFGIDFYMIRDRDGLSDKKVDELHKSNRLRCLPRRHLENYFLDARVLAQVADRFCLENTSLKNPDAVEQKLREIAHSSIGEALVLNMKEYLSVNRSLEIPTIKSIQTKGIDMLQSEFIQKTNQEVSKIQERLSEINIVEAIAQERDKLEKSLESQQWKSIFPGKIIFERYCGQQGINIDSGRVREAYVDIALKETPEIFADIIEILNSFRSL